MDVLYLGTFLTVRRISFLTPHLLYVSSPPTPSDLTPCTPGENPANKSIAKLAVLAGLKLGVSIKNAANVGSKESSKTQTKCPM